MTQLEMKLLQYFIEHEGRVIPRQELLENVWGMHGQVQTRAPDQFIRRLRKAFEPDPANPRHFLTIRDAGYRFVAEPSAVAELEDDGARKSRVRVPGPGTEGPVNILPAARDGTAASPGVAAQRRCSVAGQTSINIVARSASMSSRHGRRIQGDCLGGDPVPLRKIPDDGHVLARRARQFDRTRVQRRHEQRARLPHILTVERQQRVSGRGRHRDRWPSAVAAPRRMDDHDASVASW